MDDCLRQTIESIIKKSIPKEVTEKIIDEEITLESFSLLSENDLIYLGFKLGARKLILTWIQEQNTEDSARSEEEIITLSSWKTMSEFLVRHMDPDHGLLNKLQRRLSLSFDKIEDVKSKETFDKRNAKLLSYILNDGQFRELIEALREANQSHLANYLESSGSYDDKFKGDWPLKEKEASTLEVNEESLVDLLDPDSGLLASLYSSNVINERQKQTISSKQTPHERNESLLGFLKRRSMQDYWQTIQCLIETNQSHVAEILRTGGVVVQVHSKIEGIAKDLNVLESQISSMLTDVVLEKVPNASVERALRILEDVRLRLITAQIGGSILLFFYCQSIEDFNNLEQLIISREIDAVIKSVYASILPVLVDATVRTSAPTKKFKKAKYFLKISEIWQNHRIDRWMPYFSQTKVQELPLEMLDIVLQKVYFTFIKSKDEQNSKRDEEIIKDLGSVSFCWFQRITRQSFKTTFWSHISKFYKTKCRILHNSRRERMLIEQDIQINEKLSILKNSDFLTDVDCAMLAGESFKATKKGRFPFSTRLALVTSVLRNRFNAFLLCISNNKRKLRGRHFDIGGAPVRVEIKGWDSDKSRRTIRQSVERLSNLQFRDQSKQHHIETIGKDFKDNGIEIFNLLEDRPAIVWIWCKTPKSLERLKELHEFQKLGSAFRRTTAEESSVGNQEVNLDSDQFKQEVSALFQPSAAELAAKIDFREENSESHLIFGLTKLMNKIYALGRKTDHMDFSDVASVVYVYLDEDPYPLQQTLTMKGITHPWDIGSSENDNCFYVTESSKFGNNFVWKLTNHDTGDQSKLQIEQWISFNPTFRPTTLSVSSHGQLSMVNHLRSAILRAYNPRGQLSLCVTLPKEVKRARHAVETTSGTYVILHATLKPKQIGSESKSSIEHKDEGQILKQSQSLGPEDGGGDDENEDEEDLMWVISELSGDAKEIIRRFRPPSRDRMIEFPIYTRGYLCIDSEGRVLVADIMHHRVILFDSNLQWNRVLIPTKSELNEKENKLILRRPRRILYDEEMRQLVLAGGYEGKLGEEINIFTVS